MDEDDYSDACAALTPLAGVSDAFEEISALLNERGFEYDLDLKSFCNACTLVSALFGSLGRAFKFAEMEYCSKVNDLSAASETYLTLNTILDYDVQNNTVKTPGSHSRSLRRVRQGLDLIRVLFQNFLSSEYVSINQPTPHYQFLDIQISKLMFGTMLQAVILI